MEETTLDFLVEASAVARTYSHLESLKALRKDLSFYGSAAAAGKTLSGSGSLTAVLFVGVRAMTWADLPPLRACRVGGQYDVLWLAS